jgi:serine/threonine-protein kinase
MQRAVMNPEANPPGPSPSEPPSSVDPLFQEAFALGDLRPTGPPSSVLESLLKALSSVPRVLLRQPAVEPAESVVQVRSDELPRGATGRYQLHGEIARGGMGIVVRGRDADLGRDLAVKILLQSHRNRPEVVERFVEEAQIGGQLQHPGVVPVHELGQFEDGRPYFTMKLVRGQTLAALLSERASVEAERRRFLGIFEQVCQTLAYAHARGVIHRDLKPSNIMVGAFGEVQVMDWGLAKVLREGGVEDERRARSRDAGRSLIQTVRSEGSGAGSDTQVGSVMGTPAYMAPEQARGEIEAIDERADVFGLGAILCEMLTGGPPFRGSAQEAQRQARAGDATDARERLERCGADAEIVSLAVRCLEPLPVARPRHAGEVAAAVASYLESVEARLRRAEVERETEKARATEAERAQREAQARALAERRARRATVVLAATVLTGVLGAGGTWAWLRSEREVRIARVTGEASAALEKAALLREQARSADVEDLAAWSAARVEAERARALIAGTPVGAELEGRVRELAAGLAAEEGDRKLLAAIDAARLAATARDSRGQFALERTVPLYRAALGEWGISPASAAAAAVERLRTASGVVRRAILGALGDWYRIAAPRNAAVESELEWLEAVIEGADDDGWRLAVRDAWRKQDLAAVKGLAAEVDVAGQPTSMLIAVATSLLGMGESRSALALLERLWRVNPGDFWVNSELASCAREQPVPDPAKSLLHESIAVALRPRSTGARVNLAYELAEARRFDEAAAQLELALAMDPGEPHLRALLGRTRFFQGQREAGLALVEAVVRERPEVAIGHAVLGDLLGELGRHPESLAAGQTVARLSPDDPRAHDAVGLSLVRLARLDEAIAAFRKAIELGPLFPDAHRNLGLALLEQGRLEEAAGALARLVELRPESPRARMLLADALLRLGRPDEAATHSARAVELAPAEHDGHHLLGRAFLDAGKPGEAVGPLRTALRLHPESPDACDQLGSALAATGKLEEARAAFQEAVDLAPGHALAHQHLGVALLELGRVEEGIASLERAIHWNDTLADAHFELGKALADRKGQWVEAAAQFQRVVELTPLYAPAWANLGHTLLGVGRTVEARAALERSIQLDPGSRMAHFTLGRLLLTVGEYAAAAEANRRAIALDPEHPESHCNLGQALQRDGRFAEALAALRRGHELGSARPGWPYPSGEWVERAERYVTLEARLPAILDDAQAPIEDTVEAAGVCVRLRRPADAVKLWERAFAARPELAEDQRAAHRYNAACAAALAGMQKEARRWLEAELELLAKQAAAPPLPGARPVERVLAHWQEDRDLAPVRDEASLDALPAEEAAAWRRLWERVARLRSGS